MKGLLGTSTARCNRRHQFFGPLFSGRDKALVVDGSAKGYWRTVCDDVYLFEYGAGQAVDCRAAVADISVEQ